jgi:hypothetical protein
MPSLALRALQAGVVMLAGGAIVALTWTENFGDSSEKKGFVEQLRNGAQAIYNGVATFPALPSHPVPIHATL